MKTEKKATQMKLTDIPHGQTWVINPPNFIGLMCGAYQARFYPNQNGARVVLLYADGSSEGAQFSAEDAEKLMNTDNFFSIVSDVQSKREGK